MVRFLRIAGYVLVSASVLFGISLIVIRGYYYERGELPFWLDLLRVLLGLAMLAMVLSSGLLGLFSLFSLFQTGRADRLTALRSTGAFALTAVLTIAILGTSPGMPRVRRAEFTAVAEAAQPLIDAIRQYEADHARPPDSLAAIVPSYLPVIPKTGHARYTEFEYDSGPIDGPDVGVSWQLRVPCYSPFQWDTFFYWPTEDYSLFYEPRSIEMIGRWAYHHE
jgi:hypothetical protein